MTASDGTPRVLAPPPLALRLAEVPRGLATLADLAVQYPTLARHVPMGDGRPVLVLPGLINADGSVWLMVRFLRRLGYQAEPWRLGRNFGLRTVGAEGERLIERVRALSARRRAPVTLIGVSLGGIMARLVAHRAPDVVRAVITIASPYAAGPRATNVWRTYQWVSGEKIDDPRLAERLAEAARPLPMPATAIWSPSDGLVQGRACFVPDEPGLRVIAIPGSHIGVQWRPAVLKAVAGVLGGGVRSEP